MALVSCRALHAYRHDTATGVEEVPAGEVLWATPDELAQDRARRFPLLITLDDEHAARAAADLRWAERAAAPATLTADGRLWQYPEETTAALLEQMAARQREALGFDEAWERATGYALSPEGIL